MTTDTIAAIEQDTRQAKETVGLSDALIRLYSNRDFKTIIQEGYLHKEAVRLVHAKATPVMQTPALQANVIRDIDAIGSLQQYFQTLLIQGDTARNQIAANDAMVEDILNEERNEA